MSFDYQNSTLDELADYIETATPQVISTMIRYYANKGNADMENKIRTARKMVVKKRALVRLEAM